MKLKLTLLGAALSLGLWIVLAFVVPVRNGWVHAALAVGTGLIAKAILDSGPADSGRPTADR